jgi:hypothetical protein
LIGEVTSSLVSPWEWFSNFLSCFINTLRLVHSVYNTTSLLLPWLVVLTILSNRPIYPHCLLLSLSAPSRSTPQLQKKLPCWCDSNKHPFELQNLVGAAISGQQQNYRKERERWCKRI